MSAVADIATFRQTLLGLLAQVPDDAAPVTTRNVRGEPRLLLDGKLVPASDGETFPVIDPSVGATIGEAADGTAADMERAIGAARRAFDETTWSGDAAFRARCLRQLRSALANERESLRRDLVAEIGCAVRMTYGDQLDRPIAKLEFCAETAERYAYATRTGDTLLLREPLGVVGAITAWNIPIELELAKIGAALAAGCTIVLKPSPLAPWAGTNIGRIAAEQTDLPPGVLNVVSSSSIEVSALLTTDPRVDAVGFTGSTATGKRVMAAAAGTVKRVMLELGGKSANVILDDVDFDAIVPLAASFACFNAGQSCILPSRLLVPERHAKRCVELAADGIRNVPWGDPTDPGNFMGPLISEAQIERVQGMVERAKGTSRLVVGGNRVDRGGGFWFEPTLFADVPRDSELAREEVFGPVLAVIPYADEDDAVALANDTVYGLAGYVWSADAEHGTAVARRLRTGMVAVNGGSFIGAELPFGGRGQSGIGREWGVAGIEEFLDLKTVGVGAVT